MDKKLQKALLFQPNPPCNDCHNLKRCATEKLVCSAFISYCESACGRVLKSTSRKPYKTMEKWQQQCIRKETEALAKKDMYAPSC